MRDPDEINYPIPPNSDEYVPGEDAGLEYEDVDSEEMRESKML